MRHALTLALTALLCACTAKPTATDNAFGADGRIVAMSGGQAGPAGACFGCHGLDGLGDGDGAPRLAGLDAGYLRKQLADYALGLRPDEQMEPVAKKLSEHEKTGVAGYYASLAAPPMRATGSAPAAYASCVACHGPAGEGVGRGNPAIAGQPAAYTLTQIQRWKRSERRNDPARVMRLAVAGLNDGDAAAIAAWLAAAGTTPQPETGGASVSGAAADRE